MERTLVVTASTTLDTAALGALRALRDRDLALTVVLCSSSDAASTARMTAALDDVGVLDWRMLGSVGARMTDLVPRLYLASSDTTTELSADALSAADPGEVAADIATVIATTGARSMIFFDSPVTTGSDGGQADDGGSPDPDVSICRAAALRAAQVMTVPIFVRDRAPRVDAPDATPGDSSSVIVGPDRYRRADTEPAIVPFSLRGQGVRARVVAVLFAVAIGVATGALGTVTQAWSVAVAGVDVPLGLVGGLLVTAALLAGLRLVFDTRAMVLGAALGLVGVIALLSTESSGGSVLVPNTAASYGWVYGPVLIAMLVVAWPRIDRSRVPSSARQRDGSAQ